MEEDIKYLKSQEAYEMYFRGNPKLEKIVNRFIERINELEEENSMLKKVNNITENITAEEIENAIKEASKEYIPTILIKEKIEKRKKCIDDIKDNLDMNEGILAEISRLENEIYCLEELLSTKM